MLPVLSSVRLQTDASSCRSETSQGIIPSAFEFWDVILFSNNQPRKLPFYEWHWKLFASSEINLVYSLSDYNRAYRFLNWPNLYNDLNLFHLKWLSSRKENSIMFCHSIFLRFEKVLRCLWCPSVNNAQSTAFDTLQFSFEIYIFCQFILACCDKIMCLIYIDYKASNFEIHWIIQNEISFGFI